MRDSTTGSGTGGEVPEQHLDVEQTPPRRATGVTIREPSSTPRAAAPNAPKGKGKKKATEPLEPLNESSDENFMDSECVFELYSAPDAPAAPSSKKKASKRHPGESNTMPQAKKPPTAGLLEDGPSANATQLPSPHEQQTPPAPAGSTPSPAAPTDQT
ncbi:predicted GPI-anchored protein 58 [Humulus lupulus]|uniref:predicted GPI-anchored protein 58 n=1 Tax=Humulus lupulus TaxID=3486 RepID=UPI002B40D6A1|nr:predicted GPI-anchored protein 58 [Humulus lupulus]